MLQHNPTFLRSPSWRLPPPVSLLHPSHSHELFSPSHTVKNDYLRFTFFRHSPSKTIKPYLLLSFVRLRVGTFPLLRRNEPVCSSVRPGSRFQMQRFLFLGFLSPSGEKLAQTLFVAADGSLDSKILQCAESVAIITPHVTTTSCCGQCTQGSENLLEQRRVERQWPEIKSKVLHHYPTSHGHGIYGRSCPQEQMFLAVGQCLEGVL